MKSTENCKKYVVGCNDGKFNKILIEYDRNNIGKPKINWNLTKTAEHCETMVKNEMKWNIFYSNNINISKNNWSNMEKTETKKLGTVAWNESEENNCWEKY